MENTSSKTIFEKSQQGQHAYSLPKNHDAFMGFTPPQHLLREEPIALPETSEIDLTRHYSSLAHRNVGIDTTFYPLGSCTMKLNPRVNERCANMPEFSNTHPLCAEDLVQGNLHIIHDLLELLCKLCGMTAGSLAPNAGAQGEFAGVKMIHAYHNKRGDYERTEMLIPDNAHGTNPATARMAGYKTIPLKTNAQGDIDIDQLREMVSNKTAGLMLTNPNTLGLFSPNILEITKILCLFTIIIPLIGVGLVLGNRNERKGWKIVEDTPDMKKVPNKNGNNVNFGVERIREFNKVQAPEEVGKVNSVVNDISA